jgi:dynein light intermediate chain
MNRKTQLTLGRQDDEMFIPATIPSTQDDLKQLEERFDILLYKELALETGLCPKRRRIYDDLFNELIRITKVQCSERGLLLERIKNEYIQWMNTYEELYSSSIAYGMRRYLYKMEEQKNLESNINILENDCQQLRDELEKESIKFQKLTERVNQSNKKEDKEHRRLRNDVKILQSTNKTIRRNLENTLNQILASPIFLGEAIDYEEKTT